MKTADYLDQVKARHSLASDYALAKVLLVSTQHVSNWRAGRNFPDSFACLKLALLLGVKPEQVVGDIEVERAEKSGKTERVTAWRELLAKLGGVAAAVILSAGLVPENSYAANHLRAVSSADSLYIVGGRRRRRRARWCDGLKVV
jgi:hypothetical protein